MKLAHLNWRQAERVLADPSTTVVIPIGSTEQHGPVGPLGTDWLIPEWITNEMEKRTDILVTPVIPFGVATHHTSFPGTIDMGLETLVAVMRDGSTFFSTDGVLERLDAEALRVSRERAAASGRALSGPEKRALVDDVILGNRRLRNAEGGYWCLDPSGAGLAHLRRATLPRPEVVAVAGMSDGMWRVFGSFGLADAASELPELSAKRIEGLVAELRGLEEKDPDYVRYPRLKKSDDASVFWLGGEE